MANRRLFKKQASTRFSHALEQSHRIYVKTLYPAIGADEAQAIGRQPQRPGITLLVMQGQRDAGAMWTRLVHDRRHN